MLLLLLQYDTYLWENLKWRSKDYLEGIELPIASKWLGREAKDILGSP